MTEEEQEVHNKTHPFHVEVQYLQQEEETHLLSQTRGHPQKRQRSATQSEYATTTMGQTHNETTVPQAAIAAAAAAASSRHAGTSRSVNIGGGGGGEIVEVQGGHIVRSTGRKDRHSKVCTAKGPRDRRVRLSAHTAIQFYDVQDRLGYDRPSKAVDWLIKKAKTAIDELAELPAWKPTNTTTSTRTRTTAGDGQAAKTTAMVETDVDDFGHQQQIGNHQNNSSSSFLPPSLDSDAIADTIKSFFPMGGPAETSSSVQFQSYPPDLLSRTSSQHQDLRLSLQSFQHPMLLHHHQQQPQEEQIFGGFDGYQRMVSYGGGGDSGGSCFVFNTESQGQLQLQLQQQQQQLFGGGQSQFFSQRGPLQSSNTPSVRAWMEPGYVSSSGLNQQMFPSLHHQGFSFGGYPGFHIPTRIQGEEEHDGMANKPSSASSDSRH